MLARKSFEDYFTPRRQSHVEPDTPYSELSAYSEDEKAEEEREEDVGSNAGSHAHSSSDDDEKPTYTPTSPAVGVLGRPGHRRRPRRRKSTALRQYLLRVLHASQASSDECADPTARSLDAPIYSVGPLPPKPLSLPHRTKTLDNRTRWVLIVSVLAAAVLPILLVVAHAYASRSALDSQGCGPDPFAAPAQLSTTFEIDIAFGKLSYSLAKVIDVLWDLVVGRGGQALMAWVAYKVHVAALVHLMERSPVELQLYSASVFSGCSVRTAFEFVKRVAGQNAYGVRMSWILLSTLYVVAFPTLMASITGYVALHEALSGTEYRLQFDNETEISFGLEAGEFLRAGGQYLIDGTKYGEANLIKTHTTYCGTTSETGYYSWGTSSWLALIACIAQAVWVVGTLALWMTVSRDSQLHRAGRKTGVFRTVVDLAEVVRRELGEMCCAYSDDEIEEALLNRVRDVKYYQTEDPESSILHLGICSCDDDESLGEDVDIARARLYG